MTIQELRSSYFDWMSGLLTVDNPIINDYRNLMWHLYGIDFRWSLDMDSNRCNDAYELKERFLQGISYSRKISQNVKNRFLSDECSVLEVMVALAVRCEDHIMHNSEYGDRTGKWFYIMISNLGLKDYDDALRIPNWSDDIDSKIDNFLDRTYAPDGRGGLFWIKDCTADLRTIDIWYQMNWYLTKYYKEET